MTTPEHILTGKIVEFDPIITLLIILVGKKSFLSLIIFPKFYISYGDIFTDIIFFIIYIELNFFLYFVKLVIIFFSSFDGR